MRKPLIVGEAPSKNEVTERPIEGRIGRRLARCCGLTLEEFIERFDRVNLLHVRQDTKEKGFEFDRYAGIAAARTLFNAFYPGQRVLLLGHRVRDSFGVVNKEYFEEFYLGSAKAYVLPHPSGVNRWWNDVENEKRMYDFMQWLCAQR